MTQPVDDVISINVPALIRTLEIAREHIKDDNSLHLFVEDLVSRQQEQRPLDSKDVMDAQINCGL